MASFNKVQGVRSLYLADNGFYYVRAWIHSRAVFKSTRTKDFEEAKEERLRILAGAGAKIRREREKTAGHFYMIRIREDHAGHVVKLGFSTNVQRRLKTFQSVAPEAQLVQTWPAAATWEYPIMRRATKKNTETLFQELFRVKDLQALRRQVNFAWQVTNRQMGDHR